MAVPWPDMTPGQEQRALSIVIPVYGEGGAAQSPLPALLASLQPLRAAGAEIILVDATPGAAPVYSAQLDLWLTSAPGRARQMNAGARRASGRTLLFLHADSQLTPALLQPLLAPNRANGWGFFAVRLLPDQGLLRWVACLMNLRSRLSAIATGDQGIWVARNLFEALGGFPDQPLMEDVSMSARLRRHSRPVILPGRLGSSGRRWQARGAVRTVLQMWWLRLRYWAGADPWQLAREYYPAIDFGQPASPDGCRRR